MLLKADVRIFVQEKMYRCPAANLLYRSYRAEQTAVTGILLFMEKVCPHCFALLQIQCTIGCSLCCLPFD